MNNEQRHAIELRHARDDEQRRIADVLHRGVSQTLAGLRIQLDLCESQLQDDAQQEQRSLSELRPLLEQSLTELQELITNLRPPVPDDVGLPAALRALTCMVSVSSGKDILLHIDEPFPALLFPLETLVYTAIRETLLLLARNAELIRVEIVLTTTGDIIQLNIENLGASHLLPFPESRIQLKDLQKQITQIGGTYVLRSENGTGTKMLMTLPLLSRDRG